MIRSLGRRMGRRIAGSYAENGGSLGRLAANYPRMTSGTVAAGIGVAGVAGFAGGVNSEDVSSNAYELLTGDPNIDDYVLGRNASMRQLALPLPGSAVSGMAPVAGTLAGAGLLGGIGAAAGALATPGRRGLARAGISLATGIAGAGVGGAIGFNRSTQGYVNSTTFKDAYMGKSYNNNMPEVDGSIVLGAYNSRMGGY